MPRLAPLLLVLAAGCAEEPFAYTLDVAMELPLDVAAEVAYPALVQVDWYGQVYNLDLLCEPPAGDVGYRLQETRRLPGHASHQYVIARVVPFTADVPCDPAMDLDAWTGIDGEGAELVPYDRAMVFPDDAGPLGRRDAERFAAVDLVLGLPG